MAATDMTAIPTSKCAPLDETAFEVAVLLSLYRRREATVVDVIRTTYRRIRQDHRPDVWINIRPEADALAAAHVLAERSPESLPLYGLPFAVKDNIDVAGLPTTAACPAYSYVPDESAQCVVLLEQAGAICIGKTNLDQFATGLCGARSPYGACGSAYDRNVIAGGSSSGSAVAVALGEVAFSLGTDTGGSGRIPASFNNVVGLKPTIGVISTRGLVPNCRTLDCVSVFAQTVPDAVTVADIMRGFDARNPFSRRQPKDFSFSFAAPPASFRFGIPKADDLEFFGNDEAPQLFAAAVRRLEDIGGVAVPIDFAPFRDAGMLMFDGPWVAERLQAVGGFVAEHPDDVLAVTRGIFESAKQYSAVDAFTAQYRQQELKRQAELVFAGIDVMAVPTVGTWFTIAELLKEPIKRNSMMGFYSYFVNLLDLCAVAAPSGFYNNGIPAGLTFIAPSFHDNICAAIADCFHQTLPRRAN
jgi:allophanate hydrolase